MSGTAQELARLGAEWRDAWHERANNPLLLVWRLTGARARRTQPWLRRHPALAVGATALAITCTATNCWLLYDMLQHRPLAQAHVVVYAFSGAVVLALGLCAFGLCWLLSELYEVIQTSLGLLGTGTARKQGLTDELRLTRLTSAQIILAAVGAGLRRTALPLLQMCVLASLFVAVTRAQILPSQLFAGYYGQLKPLGSSAAAGFGFAVLGMSLITGLIVIATLTLLGVGHDLRPFQTHPGILAALIVALQPLLFAGYGASMMVLLARPIPEHAKLMAFSLHLGIKLGLFLVLLLAASCKRRYHATPLIFVSVILPFMLVLPGGLLVPVGVRLDEHFPTVSELLPYWLSFAAMQVLLLFGAALAAQLRVQSLDRERE